MKEIHFANVRTSIERQRCAIGKIDGGCARRESNGKKPGLNAVPSSSDSIGAAVTRADSLEQNRDAMPHHKARIPERRGPSHRRCRSPPYDPRVYVPARTGISSARCHPRARSPSLFPIAVAAPADTCRGSLKAEKPAFTNRVSRKTRTKGSDYNGAPNWRPGSWTWHRSKSPARKSAFRDTLKYLESLHSGPS
jgi:hypothetical protein